MPRWRDFVALVCVAAVALGAAEASVPEGCNPDGTGPHQECRKVVDSRGLRPEWVFKVYAPENMPIGTLPDGVPDPEDDEDRSEISVKVGDATIVVSQPGANSTTAGDIPFLLMYRVTTTHEDSGTARSWINTVPLDGDLKRIGDPIVMDLPTFEATQFAQGAMRPRVIHFFGGLVVVYDDVIPDGDLPVPGDLREEWESKGLLSLTGARTVYLARLTPTAEGLTVDGGMRLHEETMSQYTGTAMGGMLPSWVPWVDYRTDEQPLMMSASVNPHIVLQVNEKTGKGDVMHATHAELSSIPSLAGLTFETGTPPLLLYASRGKPLAFLAFGSATEERRLRATLEDGRVQPSSFIVGYLFAYEAPFELLKVTEPFKVMPSKAQNKPLGLVLNPLDDTREQLLLSGSLGGDACFVARLRVSTLLKSMKDVRAFPIPPMEDDQPVPAFIEIASAVSNNLLRRPKGGTKAAKTVMDITVNALEVLPDDLSLLLDQADALARGNRRGVRQSISVYSAILRAMGEGVDAEATEGGAAAAEGDVDVEVVVDADGSAEGDAEGGGLDFSGMEHLVPDLLFCRSELYRRLATEEAMKFAATDLWRAVELAPHRHEYHGDLCAVLGQSTKAKEEMDQALVQCEIAVALSPDDPLNHSNLGLVRTFSGQHDEALAALQKAQELSAAQGEDEKEANVWFNIAAAHERKEDMQEAANAYAKGLELAPEDATAHFQLAKLLANAGNVQKAVAHLKVAADIDSRFLNNLKMMMQVLADKGLAEKA